MSLENLTETEKRTLNLGNLVAQMLSDPKLSKDTKRLLKAKNPELQFPELEQEEAIEKIRADAAADTQKLRDELARRDAVSALQAEETKITEAGLDPKAVREFMQKKGITDVDVVIELFESRAQLAEPSSDIAGQPWRSQDVTQDELKAMWADPVKWREEMGYKVQKELRGTGRRTA
jgi:hypothetical protein